MSILKEIRKQPEHIRAIFMWLSVFIVFSLVVFIWVNSFQQKLTLLLNPDQESALAKEDQSPLDLLGKSLGDLRAAFANLFGLTIGIKTEKEVIEDFEERFGTKIEPRLLPISE